MRPARRRWRFAMKFVFGSLLQAACTAPAHESDPHVGQRAKTVMAQAHVVRWTAEDRLVVRLLEAFVPEHGAATVRCDGSGLFEYRVDDGLKLTSRARLWSCDRAWALNAIALARKPHLVAWSASPRPDLLLVSVDGGRTAQDTVRSCGGAIRHAEWSHDDALIVFTAQCSISPPRTVLEAYDLSSRRLSRLLDEGWIADPVVERDAGSVFALTRDATDATPSVRQISLRDRQQVTRIDGAFAIAVRGTDASVSFVRWDESTQRAILVIAGQGLARGPQTSQSLAGCVSAKPKPFEVGEAKASWSPSGRRFALSLGQCFLLGEKVDHADTLRLVSAR